MLLLETIGEYLPRRAVRRGTVLCRLIGLWCLTMGEALGAVQGTSRPEADLILQGKVWTGDSARPSAAAVAILGERIVAVGSRSEIEAWRGPDTAVIDAHQGLILPGFNDAHVHLVQAGRELDNVHLKDAPTPQEFARRIGERAEGIAPAEWIVGGDWDEQLWDPPELPTHELIDALTPETPVFVIRYDGHMALANSLAMKKAGITRETPDPPSGTIVRDAEGKPTGVLKVAAMDLVRRIIPPQIHEQRLRAAKRALKHAASLGVTSVQDMTTDYEDLAVFAELAEKGDLTARLYVAPPEKKWEDQARLGLRHAFGSASLRLGAIKGFVDGSLGSTTALFYEPYTDAPGTSGMLTRDFQDLDAARERLTRADAAGLQLCLHAIGDKAISITLDLLEDIVETNGVRDRRFRIEHAQHLVPADFDRFAELGVVASVEPYHAIDDGRWAEDRIGPERSKTTYAFRTFLDHGVHLALGTDWNGAPLDPMWTLYAATTRATLDGKHPRGWVPEQKITLEEAVRAYTSGSAYAEFQEREKGTITPGKLADLVVLSEDILAIDPAKLPEVRVEKTIVGGKVVYDAER